MYKNRTSILPLLSYTHIEVNKNVVGKCMTIHCEVYQLEQGKRLSYERKVRAQNVLTGKERLNDFHSVSLNGLPAKIFYMQLRKRKKIKTKPPAASAKPCGEIKLNPQKENKVAEFIRTFGAKEYKWLQMSVQLNTAI